MDLRSDQRGRGADSHLLCTPSAHTVSFWWAVAGLDYYLGYIENLKKVTRADMARYVKSYIFGKPYVMGVMLSSDAQETIKLTPKEANSWASTIK